MSKRIAFINFLETITSFIRNDATTARVWQLQDRNGTLADDADLATKVTGNTPQHKYTSATKTLVSQTAAQALFDNGAVALEANTLYEFDCGFSLSSMSSSNGSFGFALLGTVTFNSLNWNSMCRKSANLATQGGPSVSHNENTSNTAIVTTSSATPLAFAVIHGVLRTDAAGTLIPSVSLGVAAAAVVGINSYFKITKINSDTVGTWT